MHVAAHAQMQVVDLGGGVLRRFCQLCGRFHELDMFDSNRRSCRERLAKNNARRRKSAPVRVRAAGGRRGRPASSEDTTTDESDERSSSPDSASRGMGHALEAHDSITATGTSSLSRQQGLTSMELECGGLKLVPCISRGDAPYATMPAPAAAEPPLPPFDPMPMFGQAGLPGAAMLKQEPSLALPSIFTSLHSLDLPLPVPLASEASSGPAPSISLRAASLMPGPVSMPYAAPLTDDAESTLSPATAVLRTQQLHSRPLSFAEGRNMFAPPNPTPPLTRQPMSWPRLNPGGDGGYWTGAGALHCNALSSPLATFDSAPALQGSSLATACTTQPSIIAPCDGQSFQDLQGELTIRSLGGQETLQSLWNNIL